MLVFPLNVLSAVTQTVLRDFSPAEQEDYTKKRRTSVEIHRHFLAVERLSGFIDLGRIRRHRNVELYFEIMSQKLGKHLADGLARLRDHAAQHLGITRPSVFVFASGVEIRTFIHIGVIPPPVVEFVPTIFEDEGDESTSTRFVIGNRLFKFSNAVILK